MKKHFSSFFKKINFHKALFPVGLLMFAISVFTTCDHNPFKEKKKPIAEAGGKYLYEEDIQNLFFTVMSQEDSLAMTESYIRNWATDILLYQKAQQNIQNEEEIEELLENYRRSLLIYEYQLQLVKDRLSNKVSQEEIEKYYTENQQLFQLNEILVKGLFLIVPNQAPDLDNLRTVVANPKQEDLDAIESLSIKNTAKFEYFNERWLPLLEIQRKSPIRINNKEILKQRSFFESRDSLSTYLLYVQEYMLDGELQPVEYAESKIRGIILEQRKNNFLKQFGNKLYEDGIRNGEIKRY